MPAHAVPAHAVPAHAVPAHAVLAHAVLAHAVLALLLCANVIAVILNVASGDVVLFQKHIRNPAMFAGEKLRILCV